MIRRIFWYSLKAAKLKILKRFPEILASFQYFSWNLYYLKFHIELPLTLKYRVHVHWLPWDPMLKVPIFSRFQHFHIFRIFGYRYSCLDLEKKAIRKIMEHLNSVVKLKNVYMTTNLIFKNSSTWNNQMEEYCNKWLHFFIKIRI